MILRGLLERSLGGFVCIRGYAPLGELARVSHADLDFQRELIATHRETVIRFLRNRKDLFFPEVILSCLLRYDFSKPRAVSGLEPLAYVLGDKKFRSNVDGTSVTVRKLPFLGTTDVRASGALRIATLNVAEVEGESPLFRIDGNHRLSAADTDDEFRNILTPYCVILFDTSDDDRRNSKTIFHNINSKSIPLASEENLRIILDDETLFPDEALKEPASFGWPFLLARRTRPAISNGLLPALHHVLEHSRTVLLDLFAFLLNAKAVDESETVVAKVTKALEDVQAIYAGDDELKENRCVGLFQAFVYFCLTDDTNRHLDAFRRWVRGNHLTALTSVDAPALVEIFERVHTARNRTIFISMEFGDRTDATFKTITKTVEQINKDCRPEIKLEPLRLDKLNKGHSYAITDEILTAIEDSGLLIADLTNGNKNVYHEVGYLMGLNRGRHLGQENFVLLVRDRGKDKIDEDVSFNLKGISQIRFKEMNDLEEELDKTIRKYYRL